MLALSDDGGVPADEVLLRLTPDLTPAAGRQVVAGLVGELNRVLGLDAVVARGDRWQLAPGRVGCDVRLVGASSGGGELAGRFLPEADRLGSPEWVEWVAATRPRVALAGSPGAAAPLRINVRRIVIGVTAVAVAVAAIATFTRSPTPSGFRAGDPVLLADLDNQTGDTLFDRSLITAAGVGLGRSAQLSLLSRTRVAAALKRMAVANPDTAVTGALALEVAARENVRMVLAFGIERDGDGYRLRARLTDVFRGTTALDEVAQAETRNGTLSALDRLLTSVRRRLGEVGPIESGATQGLPAVTTTSLEALRSFADGGLAWRNGQYRIAAELWERALVLDTGFAMAHKALGSYYSMHSMRELAERNFQAALLRSNRLTELERLQTLEAYADFRGDKDSALVISGQIATRYPNLYSWYNFGISLARAGREDSAITALHRSLEFDSTHVNSNLYLAFVVGNGMGRWPEAVRYYQAGGRVDSLVLYRGNTSLDYGAALVNSGRTAEARAAYQKTRESDDVYSRTLGSRGLGYLALWEGHPDEAIGHFRGAAESSRQQSGGALSELRGRLIVAEALTLAGDTAAATTEFARARKLLDTPTGMPPVVMAMLGHGMVLAGHLRLAEEVLGVLRARFDSTRKGDRAAERYLTGDLALATGDVRGARAAFHDAAGYSGNAAEVRIAETLLALGEVDSAAAVLAPSRVDEFWPGERMFDWYPALSLRAAIHLRRGERKEATALWRQALARWAGGDSTAVPFVRAKAELAALERSR
jgi:tetratricopeptide (TPR) repeat protein